MGSKAAKCQIIAINTKNWECTFFDSQGKCANHFKRRQSTISQAMILGGLFDGKWLIKNVSDFTGRNGYENYSMAHLSTKNITSILRGEIYELNQKYQNALKAGHKKAHKTIYVLDEKMNIKSRHTSYESVAKKMGIPIGTVRSRLNRVLKLKQPTICRASDYLGLKEARKLDQIS